MLKRWKESFYLNQVCSYIKEFVHGDFGRTKPNLCDLMKTDADILELDVEVRSWFPNTFDRTLLIFYISY